jgi:NitT/TauT family transport system substrate-binding protein
MTASRALFAAGLALLLSSGGSATAAGTTNLVATYGSPDVVYAPAWIALRAGLFTKRNLTVDLQFQASSIQIPSLITGDVKLALVGCGEVAAANVGGADLVIVANMAPILPYLLMVPDSIKKASDLIGKSIAISKFGDTTDVASRIALAKLGLKPEQLTFVQVGSSANRAAALIGGAVQAGAVQPPISSDLKKRGFHTLIDIARLRIPASLALTGQRAWIAANHDTVQRFVSALMDAVAFEKRDKPYTVAILKDYLKVDDPQALSDAYDYYAREVTPSVPLPAADQCKESIDALAVTNEQLRRVDVSRFIDDEFVRAAAHERR